MKNFIIAYLSVKFIEKIIDDWFKKQDEEQIVMSMDTIIIHWILANVPLINKYYR